MKKLHTGTTVKRENVAVVLIHSDLANLTADHQIKNRQITVSGGCNVSAVVATPDSICQLRSTGSFNQIFPLYGVC